MKRAEAHVSQTVGAENLSGSHSYTDPGFIFSLFFFFLGVVMSSTFSFLSFLPSILLSFLLPSFSALPSSPPSSLPRSGEVTGQQKPHKLGQLVEPRHTQAWHRSEMGSAHCAHGPWRPRLWIRPASMQPDPELRVDSSREQVISCKRVLRGPQSSKECPGLRELDFLRVENRCVCGPGLAAQS